METLICNAYTFLEFDKDIEKYRNDTFNVRENLKNHEVEYYWDQCVEAYQNLSDYFTDEEIKKMQAFVINEL